MKGSHKRKENKGKKIGEFKKQRESHLRRTHNQTIITQMIKGDICRGDLYALGPKGMCKCFVEAMPPEPWKTPLYGQVVCLVGKGHKNLHIATINPKDCGDRCQVNLENNNNSNVFVDWDKVFGLIVSIEELEDNSKYNKGCKNIAAPILR